MEFCLKFKTTSGKLHACTDASWSTTPDAKSFSGYLLKLGESLVGWKSEKQNFVALSTTKAELIAACDCVCAVCWISSLLDKLKESDKIITSIDIRTNSKSLIDSVNNLEISSCTRHIKGKFYFFKDDKVRGYIVHSSECR